MAVTNEFLEHVLDILRPLGEIRSRPMRGGHCGLAASGLLVSAWVGSSR